MKCIHAHYDNNLNDYISDVVNVSNDINEEKIRCKKCGKILIGDDVISFMFIIHPLRYLHDLVIEGPIIPPSRKTIEKNLESLGLLGPEIKEDD